ncbi:MAG: transposase [Caldilineaceae bacterium SB0664_bin_27]|uniref:Transposase n=1 Tax=Caldilineaceae bacterium SB0664_bin_27 TaxID=2605260 RepID=A0A6B0Z0D4_9CHLR|nr:transposase [Caldilineaceae bacterium SB0664_bin_27]
MRRLLWQVAEVRAGKPDGFHLFLHGDLYFPYTGTVWWDLPSYLGRWNSVFRCNPCWCCNGVWERVLASSIAERTILSRGGFGTKLYVLVDTAGRLSTPIPTPGKAGGAARRQISAQGSEPVIPRKRNHWSPVVHDRKLCRKRNIVERGVGWPKQGRSIDIGYEGPLPAIRDASCLQMFYIGCPTPLSPNSTRTKMLTTQFSRRFQMQIQLDELNSDMTLQSRSQQGFGTVRAMLAVPIRPSCGKESGTKENLCHPMPLAVIQCRGQLPRSARNVRRGDQAG